MPKPAKPTTAEHSEMQQLSAAIVESVRVNAKIPLPGLKAVAIQYTGIFFDAVEVEGFVLKLAQEGVRLEAALIASEMRVMALTDVIETADATADRLRKLLEQACEYIEASTDPDEKHPEAQRLRRLAGGGE